VTVPTVTVEFAFSIGAGTTGYLYLDDTARGKLDTGTLAPDNLWVDLAHPALAMDIMRGSQRFDGVTVRYEASRAAYVLDNTDRSLDPTNLAGPYVSANVTQVTPMRGVRTRATWAGVTYALFRGFVDSWTVNWADPWSDTTAHCSDGIKVLANYNGVAVAAVGAGDDTGARIGRLLDNAGWAATDRVLDTGNTTVQATTLAANTWTEVLLTADTEAGEVYVDGSGRVVFRRRQAAQTDTRSNTSQATFGDGAGELPYESVKVAYDDTQVRNIIRITRVGGTQQVTSDTTSTAQYLNHSWERNDLIMQTDTDAANYAGYVLYQNKDAELRFTELVVNPHADETNLFPQVLGRELGDRITVKRRPPGGGTVISQDCFIRGVHHTLKNKQWSTTWTLQSATKSAFFTLDNTVLGVLDTDALGY